MTEQELVPTEPLSGARPIQGPVSARYEVVRVIGEGGMGVVYEAIDRERRERVALKTLRTFDPDALYRFKNEFRTLADLRHGNLVRLHELVMTDAEQVFFTMELVSGRDFRAYATRPEIEEARAKRGQRSSSAPPTQPTRIPVRTSARPPAAGAPARGGDSPADLGRLRAALLGLAEGLHALHSAGKLHRDIKPSNILVTGEGRVVLLDFGVATELAGLKEEGREVEMVGTAAYMAPEQAAGEPPTPASDWYSVGVVLYEALVGRPPFVGSTFEVMQRKNLLDAEPPSAWVTGVPDDLDALCRGLLQREPEMRPHGTAILRQLRASRNSGAPQSLRPSFAGPDGTFVGREAQLGLLREAFDTACSGCSITVRVGGASGMGKSTLVQHFLDQLSGSGRALVLRGRAYERETVPYKAVDSVVDALSRYLMRASEEGDALELPEGLAALARLFPVLRRVPSLAAAAEERMDNPLEVRRRAFHGMRALLGALARRRPVVVYIDDVQWGDTDSAALLIDLVRPPDAPPLLLVMTYRDNEERTSPFLAETRALWPGGAEAREISVGPLDPPDAERLALTLFEGGDEIGPRVAKAAARESRGNPFLIGELVRSNLSTTAGASTLNVLTIEQMVGERLDRLPPEAQRWLEIVAVGGRPLPIALVADAAGIYENVQGVVERAAAGRFVRTGLRAGHETVEMGHDRIREAIVARLPPATLKAHHERLSRVLEAMPGADLEALAVHLLGADQPARAAAYAERAAEQAAAKIAFDQAVRLYRMALDMVPESSADAQRLRTRLAQVLEWSGRGAAAATVYLSAAERAPAMQRVELERSAAEQLLATGRIDEGMAVLDRALAFVGMRRPGSALVAIVWLLFYRLCVRLRGFRVEERAAEDVARMARARIDTLYAVGIGLSFVDTVQAACMQARHVLMALRFGDRFQVLRAAAIENATLASAGGKAGRPERELAALVDRFSVGTGDPEGPAFALGTKGVALFLRGRWSEALETQDVAYARFPTSRAGWHANGQLFAIWSLTFLGRLEEFRRRHARLLVDAEERGDLYTTVNLRIGYSNLAWLVVDDVESARRHVREAMSVWSVQGYLLQHYRAMVADANIELYDGDGRKAYERVVRDEARLKKSFLLRVQYVRADARFVRAKAALAAAAEAADGASLVAEAEGLARRLAGERMAWTDLFASIVLAAVASAKANRREAARLLRIALEQAEAAEMAMYAAAIRRQLGLLVGGDEGRALVAQGDEAMTAEGVHVPERFARMLVPGRWVAPDSTNHVP